jgi:hypothetical protein
MKLMLNNNVMLRDSQPQITNFIRTRRLLAAIWPRCALIVRKKIEKSLLPRGRFDCGFVCFGGAGLAGLEIPRGEL